MRGREGGGEGRGRRGEGRGGGGEGRGGEGEERGGEGRGRRGNMYRIACTAVHTCTCTRSSQNVYSTTTHSEGFVAECA